MSSRLARQKALDHCKGVCKSHFEGLALNVDFDQPITTDVAWTPHVIAVNAEKYGIDIIVKPKLDPFWLKVYRADVKPVISSVNIVIAFPFNIALQLSLKDLQSYFENELSVIVVYDNTLDLFAKGSSNSAAFTANALLRSLRDKKANLLSNALNSCPRGRVSFSQFEQVCLDIFRTLFIPPLSAPYIQPSTLLSLRRRDHVFPNHAKQGFWFETKQDYKATCILLECKNLNSPISVDEIDDALKYLHEKGIGLFGILISRTATDRNAKAQQVSKWKDESKLVVDLQDNDLLEMIELYRNLEDPTEVIQNKIDEFMLRVI